MRPNTFYPEIILKVENVNLDNATIEGINDKGEKIKVFLNNTETGEKFTKEDFVKLIENKAKRSISDTILKTLTEIISNNEKISEKIGKEILSSNPSVMSNPSKYFNELQAKYREKATAIARDMYTIQKGMVIKIAGITDKTGKNISFKTSPNIAKKVPGFYILSVPNGKNPLFKKVPIRLVPNKKGKFKAVTDGAFIESEEYKSILGHYIRTYKAYEEGKINAKPLVFYSFKAFTDNDKKVQEAVEKLKVKIQNIKNYDELSNLMAKFITYVENNKLFKKISVFLPLENVDISIDKILNDIYEKLERTTFSNSISKGFIDEYTIKDIVKEVTESISTFTFYKLKEGNKRYGFFTENIQKEKIVPSYVYDKIIEKAESIVKEKLQEIQKEDKDNEKKHNDPSL